VRILGLGGLDHNGSAALVEDGRLRSFLEVERVSRIKNQGLDSQGALETLLDRLDVGRVDRIAVADQAFFEIHAPWLVPYLDSRFPDVPRSVHRHHTAHVACAFAGSPFEAATLVSIDGKGDGASAALGRATRAHGPRVDLEVPSAHSIGRLWWAASEFAGLPGHHSAGKTMALAAFGCPRYLEDIAAHVAIDDGVFRFVAGSLHPDTFRQVPRLVAWFEELTGVEPARDGHIADAHRDLAASIQRLTEDLVLAFVRSGVRRTEVPSVCLAGGVALNGLANERLLAEGAALALHVPSCTDDRGLAIGAAALAAWEAGVRIEAEEPWLSPFLGPEPDLAVPTQTAFIEVLDGEAALEEVAGALIRGEVVAWFEGRDEAGPRALGHRSLIASPTFDWMRDQLNARVKARAVQAVWLLRARERGR